MDIDDFYADLRNQTSMRAGTEGTFTPEAFMGEVADRLIDAEEVGNLQVLTFEGVGKNRRKLAVHGYDLDDGDESISLAVLQYFGSGTLSTLGSPEASDRLRALQYFLEEAVSGEFIQGREPSSPAYQLAEDLRARQRKVSKYRLYLVTDAELSGRAKSIEVSSLNGTRVEFHIWDIKRLHQVHESAQGREELEINFSEWSDGGIPALEVRDPGTELTTVLAALPGSVVADLYDRYGSRLLEGNVRSFLSMRGRTNQGIRRTVLTEPGHFLAFNNGISATATHVDIRAGRIVSARDLQIVNGGQTTASLYYARRDTKADLSDVFVQMKLVVVEASRANEMIPLISRYANTQNTVSEADFFSNHPFHVRMEELSKRTLAPSATGVNYQTKWYYERTRGQHQNERNRRTPADARKFEAEYPRAQVITKTDAAKFVVSWGMEPHQVSAGAQKNFKAFADMVAKDFNSNEAQFNESYFKLLVAKAILFREVRLAISKSDWYVPGQYLANLATYAIAKLAYEVQKQPAGKGFKLETVWAEQSVSPSVCTEVVEIARKVLGVLISDDRPVQNVTEWAKRKQCWDEVKAIHHRLSDDFVRDDRRAQVAAGGRAQTTVADRFDPSKRSSVHVASISAEDWLAVTRFLRSSKSLSRTDEVLLEKVNRGHSGVLDQRDASALLQLFVKAENAGFSASTR